MSANETELKLEASVTNAENGQLVRAFASSIIYPENFRMDFSIPSPAVIHPDMPFMAWVIIGYFLLWLHEEQYCYEWPMEMKGQPTFTSVSNSFFNWQFGISQDY